VTKYDRRLLWLNVSDHEHLEQPLYVQIYRVLSNGDELELKRMYETLNLYDDNCDVSSPQLILRFNTVY